MSTVRPQIFLSGAASLVQVAEHIGQRAFEPVQDQLEPAQGDALISVLQPMDGGGRQPDFLAELRKGHLVALLTDEAGQLLVETGRHLATMNKRLFFMRNISIARRSVPWLPCQSREFVFSPVWPWSVAQPSLLVCLYSNTGDADNALTWLHEAVVADGYTNVAEIKTDPNLATLRKKKPAEIADLTALRCEWRLDYGVMNDDLVVTNHSAYALTRLTISGSIQPNNKAWQDLSVDTIPAGSSYRWKKAVSVPGSRANVDANRLQLRRDQGECQMTPEP